MLAYDKKLSDEGIEEAKEPNVQLCLPASQTDESSEDLQPGEDNQSQLDAKMGIKTRRMSKLRHK